MNTISITRTSNTPDVTFDSEQGKLEIIGISIPERTVDFYRPLIEKLQKYQHNPAATTTVDIKLTYLNTPSVRCIQDILKMLTEIQNKGNEVVVNWFYDKEDEDMHEVGKNFHFLTGLNFKVTPN